MKTAARFALLAATLAVASTCWAARPDAHEQRFFAAVDRGDVEGVLELMHPATRELVDAPVLEAWMAALHDRLGTPGQIEVLEQTTEQRLSGRRDQTRATVTFDRGTAESQLTVLDGEIVAFHVASEAMADWFQGPTSIDPYADAAEAFIETFLDGQATAARDRMHPALQKEISLERLEGMIAKVCGNGGALRQLTLRDHRFSLEGSAPALFLTYEVECEKASGTCEVEFQFDGMKGYLLGFHFR